MHFRGYPGNILIPCEGEDSIKWSFINSLKEVRAFWILFFKSKMMQIIISSYYIGLSLFLLFVLGVDDNPTGNVCMTMQKSF